MSGNKIRSIILVFACLSLPTHLAAAASPPHPECPLVNQENSWRDYIVGRVASGGGAEEEKSNYFSVQFDNMAGIRDAKEYAGRDDPLGALWKGSCYTVFYDRGRGDWWVSGYNEQKAEGGLWKSSGANPENYRISLWGRIFEYNEDGQIIDGEYGHVGNLRCVLDHSVCGQYGD